MWKKEHKLFNLLAFVNEYLAVYIQLKTHIQIDTHGTNVLLINLFSDYRPSFPVNLKLTCFCFGLFWAGRKQLWEETLESMSILACVAQMVGALLCALRGSLIPSQGTYPGLNPSWGAYGRQLTEISLSHWCFSFPPSTFLSLSKTNSIKNK